MKNLHGVTSLSDVDRRIVLSQVVTDLGYSHDLVSNDFRVWTGEDIVRPDIVAFARKEPRDMTTATLVGTIASGEDEAAEHRLWARAIASPVSLISLPDRFEIWSVGAEATADHRVEGVPHGLAFQAAGRLRASLEPSALLRAKHASRQLHLFPVDVTLLASARNRSASYLTSAVDEAMANVLGDLPRRRVSNKNFGKASRLIIGAMAALMIRDKLAAPDSADLPIDQALDVFPGYFHWLSELNSIDRAKFFAVAEILGSGVDYSGLDPTVVSHVYEDAVVNEAVRHDLGIYYTPPDLARRIMDHIPFEAVTTEARTVFDPACGSGTLLLAAHNRLQSLSFDGDVFSQHEFLRAHLVGYDNDPFAVEITKLALLLNALPAGNSWRVETHDVADALPESEDAPNFVVTNPPWQNIRSQGGKRVERADAFVRTLIERTAPGGHVALILPAPWLSSGTSAEARRSLMQQMSVYEIWRLPEGTFGSAQYAACVVFAERQRKDRRVVFRRVVRKSSLPGFYRTGAPDAIYLSSPEEGLTEDSLLRGPLDAVREQLLELPRLSDLARVSSGPVPLPPVSARGEHGPYRWLPEAGALPAFAEAPESALGRVKYPEDFSRRGKNVQQFLGKKLLVSKMRNPDNPWRLRVGVDLRGVIPRQSLFVVTPSDPSDEKFFGLLAVLGSSIASCWVDTLAPRMDIATDVFKNLPIPSDQANWPELARVGRRVFDAATVERLDRGHLEELETVVAEAYGLGDFAPEAVRPHFEGFRAGDGIVRFPVADDASSATADALFETGITRYGAVQSVAFAEVKLWVPGVTDEEGDWFPMPPRMPGWLAQPGATFELRTVDARDIAGGEYHFQPHSDQGLDDLIASHATRHGE